MTQPVWGPVQLDITEVLTQTPATVADVVAMLTALQPLLEKADESGGPNAISDFNRLYRVITTEILNRLNAGSFADPTFLTTLDVQFAQRYFEALRRWGRGATDTPYAWQVLFGRLHDPVHPLPAAVAGVNAHINYDLPFALLHTWQRVGSSPADRRQHADYLLVNDVFYAEIPSLRRSYLTTWQLFLDRLNGPLDDWYEDRVVQFARDLAWCDGERLWAKRDDEAALARLDSSLDRHAALLGWALLSPACAFLQ